jgi:hypothetical protein
MDSENYYNPFVVGSIVHGEQFVGRQAEILQVQQRLNLYSRGQAGSISIVGSPRVGKSSLAYQVLFEPREKLTERKILTSWIHLPNFEDLEGLFCELVRKTLNSLENVNVEDEILIKDGKKLLESPLSWGYLQTDVREFFAQVNKLGWRVIFIIDEFDYARQIFRGNKGFEALRELNYNPEWRIYWVTISRRPLSEIVNKSGTGISTFPGIFETLTLRCFDQEELDKLLEKLQIAGIEPDPKIFEFIYINTGGHPWLASMVASHLANLWLDQQQINLEQALQNSISEFYWYYDTLVDLLRQDGSLEKMLQILFGPVITATRVDVEQLTRYGLIKPSAKDFYTAFSDHFQDYLQLVERSVDLWPLWRKTERRLRLFIAEKLEADYKTENWIAQVENNRPNLKIDIFDPCREKQENEKKKFGDRASVNLLDFAYPMDLYKIIAAYWTIFQPILKQDKKHWEQRFSLLNKVRTSMAHMRDESIAAHERQLAEAYCDEILYLLDQDK